MAVLVGVHGIAQQQLGRNQLVDDWAPALRDGLERAQGGRPQPDPSFDIAFYGDLFLPRSRGGSVAKGGEADADDWWESLADDEARELRETVEEVLTPEQIAAVEEEKAYTRIPSWLRALDHYFGKGAAPLFVGELRQVRRYLTEPALKKKADTVVRDTIARGTGKTDCRVLIGHSLGSVVAFEYVRQNPRELDLLLTLGSPLGLKAVRTLMPDPGYGAATGIPSSLRAWVDVRDTHDPVACAGGLKRFWSKVDDRPPVPNGKDAHSITAYLGKETTGRAILDAVPALQGPP